MPRHSILPRFLQPMTVLTAAIGISFAALCFIQLRPISFTRWVIFYSRQMDNPYDAGGKFGQTMVWLGHGHNVVLRYSGFDRTDRSQIDSIESLARIANYMLCPGRGWEMFDDQVPTDPDRWLTDHDVRGMFWFHRTPQGETHLRVLSSRQAIEAALKSNA